MVLWTGCQTPEEVHTAKTAMLAPKVSYPAMGTIERFDPALDDILPPYAVLERLAQGFEWSEGPVWVPSQQILLFSDVPDNKVYRWHEVAGLQVAMAPSGYTGAETGRREPGSNGLALDPEGRLVLCQHGDRRVARVNWDGEVQALTSHYKHLRFNSPNDLAFASNGDMYFTDPPYGLDGGNDDPAKELMFNGVFRLKPNGELTLLTDELTYPNGIALSPDEKQLYVAISDAARPVVMVYDLNTDGTLAGDGRVFFNAKALADEGRPGLPDGLKVDLKGNVFATGPGGVLVISPEGKLLGIINTGEATANCAWGNDGSVLYITADGVLCRVKTWTQGFVPVLKYWRL